MADYRQSRADLRSALRDAQGLEKRPGGSFRDPVSQEDIFTAPEPAAPRPAFCRQMVVWSCVSFVFLILSLILTDLWSRCGFHTLNFYYYLTEWSWPRYVIGLIPPLLVLLGAWAVQNRPDLLRILAVLCTVFLVLLILAMIIYDIRTEFGVPHWFYRSINGCDFLGRFIALILEPSLLGRPLTVVTFAGSFCGFASVALSTGVLWAFRRSAR